MILKRHDFDDFHGRRLLCVANGRCVESGRSPLLQRCMFWHVLRLICIDAAHTIWRVSETPHVQYTESEGWKTPHSFSLFPCLPTLWQGLHTTALVIRPQEMMRFSGRQADQARRRNPRAHSSPFSLPSKTRWPHFKAITSPIQLTSCG